MKIECPFCNGSGWETAEDSKTGDPVPAPCSECNGTGKIEAEEYERESKIS